MNMQFSDQIALLSFYINQNYVQPQNYNKYYFIVYIYEEPNGRVIDEVWNKGTAFPDTKYYYGEPDHSKKILYIFSIVTTGDNCFLFVFLNQ